ncbi:uncharacterized protein LOC135399566 [Ornithodoros turicata]|uniref:uncharacterized protein LOC135399566 n=1 Tax=Ornithodoros turicata TaxID=34597 RepID=UPI00313888E5
MKRMAKGGCHAQRTVTLVTGRKSLPTGESTSQESESPSSSSSSRNVSLDESRGGIRCSTPLFTTHRRSVSLRRIQQQSIVADYSSDTSSEEEFSDKLRDMCKSQENLTSSNIPPQHWRRFLPLGSPLNDGLPSSQVNRDYFVSDPPWEDHSSDDQLDTYKSCPDTGQVKRFVSDASPNQKRSRSAHSATSLASSSPSLSPVLRGGLLWKGPSTYAATYLHESDGVSGLLENYAEEEGEVTEMQDPALSVAPVVVPAETTRVTRPWSPPQKPWPYSVGGDIGMIDTHCHLDFLFRKVCFQGTFARFRSIYERTFPSCYEGCVAIFCNPASFGNPLVWKNLLKEDGVWGSFGCHPHMAQEYTEETDEHLIQALQHPKVVALGEIGLDYSHKNSCNHDVQKSVFRRQLCLALQFQLPIVIHCRDAMPDTLNILREVIPRNHPVHRHCFTGSWAEAEMWLDAFPMLFLGLTPLVSYAYNDDLREAARRIPLERVLLETDAPYFLPRSEIGNVPHSHPGMAIHVATALAFLKNVPLETVLKAVRENAHRMYGI